MRIPIQLNHNLNEIGQSYGKFGLQAAGTDRISINQSCYNMLHTLINALALEVKELYQCCGDKVLLSRYRLGIITANIQKEIHCAGTAIVHFPTGENPGVRKHSVI